MAQTVQRRNCVDTHAKEVVRTRLIQLDNLGIGLDQIQQEILVTHARQPALLLCLRETRHVIHFVGLEPGNVTLRLDRKRRHGEEFG